MQRRRLNQEYAFWIGVFLVLLAAVFFRYWPHLFAGFWQDDFAFARTIAPFHPRYLFEFFSPTRGWFYRPVFLIYFSVLRLLFGVNPIAFHAASFVLHSLNLLLLAALMRRLAGKDSVAVTAIGVTLLGLLFYPGIAPSSLDSVDRGISAVVWISSASTLLAMLFSLLCLHCWLWFRRRADARFYGAALVFFFAALISKEDASALPLVLLFFDWTLEPRLALRKRAQEFAPFLLAFALFIVLDLIAYKHYQVFGTVGLGESLTKFSRYRLVLSFLSLVTLNIWLDLIWFAAGIVCLGIWANRYDRAAAFFCVWCCIFALPTIVMAGPHAEAARFFYFPGFGVVACFALIIRHLLYQSAKDQTTSYILVPLALLTALCLLPFSSFVADLFFDPVAVWLAMIVVAGMSWVLWRTKVWRGALVVAVLLSYIASQGEIYGPDWGFFSWPLLSLIAATLLSVGRRDIVGVWLAFSLSVGQPSPSVYWVLLLILGESRQWLLHGISKIKKEFDFVPKSEEITN
jgi:hypothetical protein